MPSEKISMTQESINASTLISTELFQHCAVDMHDEICWEEFLRRYRTLITRSVTCTYRRFMNGNHAPSWRIAELMQEVYLRLLNNECALLRQFRGENENAAEAYIAQIAMNTVSDVLKREMAWKRYGDKSATSLDEIPSLLNDTRYQETISFPVGLIERDLIRILIHSGSNWQRDAAIFFLHIRFGLTIKEIVRTNLFQLQPTSIFGVIVRVRRRLRQSLSTPAVNDDRKLALPQI